MSLLTLTPHNNENKRTYSHGATRRPLRPSRLSSPNVALLPLLRVLPAPERIRLARDRNSASGKDFQDA